MSNKEIVLDAVRQMPDDASLDDIRERIAILAAIHHGVDDADSGKVVPHEEVKKRLATWISK